jgi:hypothetical protein
MTSQAGAALNTEQSETTLFWKHLALAHLISGIDPSMDIRTPIIGKTHPSAKIGGTFSVFYSNVASDFGSRHYLVLTNSPSNLLAGSASIGTLAVSPINAAKIDRKMDDGMPDTGDVRAEADGSKCEAAYKYLNLEEKNCIMYFKLD